MTRRDQGGYILGYVLFGLAVLSLSIGTMARMNTSADAGKKMAETREEIVHQVQLIRSKLIACTIQYPAGDNGLGYRQQFPSAPVSGLVKDAICPGNPGANKSLWTAADGTYMPRQLPGFSEWSLEHDAGSLRLVITATSAERSAEAALHNASLKFGDQASITGKTMTIVIAS